MSQLTCRFCATPLHYSLVDLGMSPLSNSYVPVAELDLMEAFYPLHVRVCDKCFLVQLPELQTPEHIFRDYAYFSSYSSSWLEHSRLYAEKVTARFGLDKSSQIIEVASNDGYLLRFFQQKGLPVLGVEPAANVAEVAQGVGIPTIVKFFGVETANELVESGYRADLLVANNVMGHVPDLNDFIGGLQLLLSPTGVLTVEFQHVLRLMENSQFDTIYHEHFSYLSLLTIEKMFEHHGLRVFDVDELTTHGGSLRVYACRAENTELSVGPNVDIVREAEADLKYMETYAAFSERAHQVRYGLLEFLINARREGKVVVGYGAPAKGNTLLNSCGVRGDLLPYTVDLSPHKQGLFLPGTHIPIFAPEHIEKTKPDYVLLLAWNLKDEIIAQMSGIRAWGGKFVVPIPRLEVIE
ncbi:class I SAM-dependent methyltransferase [bacterium]|nr:MAG: class I SAM-dependent methyltransferase [bacterium]